MKNRKLLHILLFFGLILATSQCSQRHENLTCFPNQLINVQLDLNLAAYHNLANVGGWIYVQGAGAGNRGLIIVHSAPNAFKVYDRNAPHLCPDGNTTTLEVVDNIKIICPKDGAEWILLTGQPSKIANTAPRTYLYNYNPSFRILSVYN